MLTLLTVAIIGGVCVYGMSPEDRLRLLRTIDTFLRHIVDGATRSDPDDERFRAALRARTPWPFVTIGLVTLNVTLFVCLLFGAGRLADSQTLLAWGGNLGTRTSNGEWWRLATAMFVHSGMLPLVVNIAMIVYTGPLLERLVGPFAFGGMYAAAGVLANAAAVLAHPLDLSVGASGAICGEAAVLTTSWVWGLRRASELGIPRITAKRLAVAGAVFAAYSFANGDLPFVAELTALFVGLIGGAVLTRRVQDATPSPRRVACVLAGAAVAAVVFAVPVRGMTDVRPEIAHLVALEERTATAYASAVERVRKGRLATYALADMIAQTIVPELEAAETHLNRVGRVPSEQQPLLADAHEYLRLRTESWHLRAQGLRKAGRVAPRDLAASYSPASGAASRSRAEAQHRASMNTLGRAEGAERASLEVLQRLR